MSKKKSTSNSDTPKQCEPEFKPGDKPFLEYDGTVLNANVPWDELVSELEASGCTAKDIAQYAECELSVIHEISKKIYDNLCFRSGARIVTMHYTRSSHKCSEF